jgi:Xaa-Pro aminopeptidase
MSRIDALRKRLVEVEADAFFSLSPPINYYLTGFRGTTSAVLVTETDAKFLCDFRYTEQAQTQVRYCVVEEVSGGMTTRVGEQLNALGAKTIAYDSGYLTVQEMLGVDKATDGELKPVGNLTSVLRSVKSPAEIEKIRTASQLAEGVLADMVPTLETGTIENEFAAAFEYEFKKRGAEGSSFDMIALFGSRSSLPHGVPKDTALSEGDVVLLDFGCLLDAYCSDLTRTYTFGRIPGPWFEEIYELTRNAQAIAIDAVAPGKTGREVDAVARDHIAEAGYGDYFGHGLGHGLGIEIHEAPRVSTLSETVLEPGMVVTIEPGIYLPGKGGVRIEDVVAVTDSGCELLSDTPKELTVLGN